MQLADHKKYIKRMSRKSLEFVKKLCDNAQLSGYEFMPSQKKDLNLVRIITILNLTNVFVVGILPRPKCAIKSITTIDFIGTVRRIEADMKRWFGFIAAILLLIQLVNACSQVTANVGAQKGNISVS